MKQGFIKVAAVTPRIKVADTDYNATAIIEKLEEAMAEGAKVIVFPELCITGYTCGDLFFQELLLAKSREALLHIAETTSGRDAIVFVGLPFERGNKLYNVAAVLYDGRVIAIIPKINIPNYREFSEVRYFSPGNAKPVRYRLGEEEVPFGGNILIEALEIEGLSIGCEICEDLWGARTPSTSHILAGASIMVNLSASPEVVGKSDFREKLIGMTSAKLMTGYIYANAGEGESTQDLVFAGDNLIAENGIVLSKSQLFSTGILYGEIDIHRIRSERRRMNTLVAESREDYTIIQVDVDVEETVLTRKFHPFPFVPSSKTTRKKRCQEVLAIQMHGLKKRYEHIGSKKAIIGLSGGLDSTLALMVTVKAFDQLGIDRDGILCVTMPGFGTTDRTYTNACALAEVLGTTLMEVDIKEAMIQHFEDIKQDINSKDITYENSQARERTQILMDIANKTGGIVIGTGDMSELALGWSTFNGDHMSMYGVNAGVPKTLVKYLVQYCADTSEKQKLQAILLDIVDTPVSPELLPPEDGMIVQKTEEIVGPYTLHDFFLYYMLRFGYEPAKIYRIAKQTFDGQYEAAVILKWMKIFYKRFFISQFKRSCLPDGPKVGSIGLSPRGDLRMPSDACVQIWLDQIDTLK